MTNPGTTRITVVSLVVGAALLATLSLALVFITVGIQKKIPARESVRYREYRLTDGLRQTSDDLTRMARLYSVTGDDRYRRYFQEILDIRNGQTPRPADYQGIYWDVVVATGERPTAGGEAVSLDTLLERAGFSTKQMALLQESETNSNALAELEAEAMQAVSDADLERARSILHGVAYHDRKADIMRPLASVLASIDETADAEIARYDRQSRTAASASVVSLALSILLSAAAALMAFRSLRGDDETARR